jgi:crotonobetainyl-CoA:carnitine CoA-transferase CaiB-like acyl-CoA transferase
VQTREDLLTDPQIVVNELIVESDHPHVGRLRQTRPAARFDVTSPEVLRIPAPRLGEHTDSVLSEFGVSAAQLAELREAGVVA